MPKFVPKRFEQILAQMIARVVARTDLSDVSDSSVVKHILAAAARADDEQYYQMSLLLQLFSIDTATGEDLDERAKDVQPATISRIPAIKATGLVTFSRNASGPLTVNIPSGTKVKTADGKTFTTTAATSITPTSVEQISGHGVGRDAAPVAAVADVPGAAGNVATNTIIKFVSKPQNVDEVTNQAPFTGGQDKETDDAFRARIKGFIAGLARSTVGAIEANLAGQEDPTTGKSVRSVKVIEDIVDRGNVTVYIDDGTGAAETTAAIVGENVTNGLAGPPANSAVGGEEFLYLDFIPVKASVAPTLTSSTRGALTQGTHYILNAPAGQLYFTPPLVPGEVITADYTYFTGLIQFVQKIVDGDPADRTNFPGLRAAGVLATVATPQILVQNITAVVTVLDGYNQTEVKNAVKEAFKTYVNGLSISGDVVRNELIARAMRVTGVYNVNLTLPVADVILLDDQLARTTDVNIIIS